MKGGNHTTTLSSPPYASYADVDHGNIWKDFRSYDGKPFLSEVRNLGLMLNVVWFQPYDKVKDSVGVIVPSCNESAS